MLVKNIEIFLKKEKTKRDKMIINDIKISLKTKTKGRLSIEGIILRQTKKKPFKNKERVIFLASTFISLLKTL